MFAHMVQQVIFYIFRLIFYIYLASVLFYIILFLLLWGLTRNWVQHCALSMQHVIEWQWRYLESVSCGSRGQAAPSSAGMFWTIIGTTVQLFQHWCKEKLCDRVNKTFCLVKFRSLITPSFFCIEQTHTHTHRVVHSIYRWQWVHAMMENHLFSSFTNCFPNELVISKIVPANEAVILQIVRVAENKEREEWLWQPRQRTAMHWK